MKVVVNRCYGGFSLSQKAYEALGLEWDGHGYAYRMNDEDRANPDLVRVVEELGADADGAFAELQVVEIPDDIKWYIEEYDGKEWVAEAHQTW